MNTTLKIVVAAAAGVAVGAAVGILFAPEKGADLRKQIAAQGKKFADNIKSELECKKNGWKEKVKDLAS